jgi:glycosyltransferase involved in cell wall biosynthesis
VATTPVRISIAMATYNGARYLEAQLESFLAQTRLPDELVLSDDASTDDTHAILSAFSERAPFPVIVHRNEQRLGYGQNFNRALTLTTGDLVFMSDQDDVWFPEKLARMTNAAQSTPHHLLLMHDAEITDGALRSTGRTIMAQRRRSGYREIDFVHGCCTAVKRELLDLCLPIPVEMPHDEWLVQVSDAMTVRHVVRDVLMMYRRHSGVSSQGGIHPHRYWVQLRRRFVRRFRPTTSAHRVANAGARQSIGKQVDDLRRLRLWAEKAVRTASSERQPTLLAMVESLLRRERVYAERERIWSEGLWRRTSLVWDLWRRGGYAASSGWLSAVRDLLA